MKIKLANIFVEDQNHARQFYTETLGFIVKHDIPLGAFQWLTVISPENPDGAELLLEPNENPIAKTYQKALFEQGIAAVVFMVEDLDKEFQKLSAKNVEFKVQPMTSPHGKFAIINDTCGNWVHLQQET
ncbi:VOC family protein [Bdellovibrio reynosensis]|uniref:VOC family protein n=1 Tax=Bdellovibrio reynosensis TaxID=2835041 RepID=A0ABY4CAM4_9BACT|nr:VOC family protein [Bdellovibrio reynosensis]UOF01977.1 VOC family protein [Bdellovibrio reynosensis]